MCGENLFLAETIHVSFSFNVPRFNFNSTWIVLSTFQIAGWSDLIVHFLIRVETADAAADMMRNAPSKTVIPQNPRNNPSEPPKSEKDLKNLNARNEKRIWQQYSHLQCQ